VAVALNLVPSGAIAFLWLIGVVRDRIGPREDRFFASQTSGRSVSRRRDTSRMSCGGQLAGAPEERA
jgi:hypothetical protein